MGDFFAGAVLRQALRAIQGDSCLTVNQRPAAVECGIMNNDEQTEG